MTNTSHNTKHNAPPRVMRIAVSLVVTALMGTAAEPSRAASVRVWASAVVVTDDIHLNDVSELRGFDAKTELALRQARIMPSPAPGQSLTLPQGVIRDAIRAAGANMALVTVSGAARCEVVRPASSVALVTATEPTKRVKSRVDPSSSVDHSQAGPHASAKSDATMRAAVVRFFESELARYRGRADVMFGRSAQQLLELASPQYTFRVRRSGSTVLGLVAVEVDVISNGRVVQTVPLVVQVSMTRDVVVARRSINQGATIGAGDIETTELRFSRVDQIGLLDVERIIGQRAKRFVSSGTMIDLSDVESVPIIIRGQLITLVSAVGGIEIVTTGKAAADGLFGDTIKVRAADNRRIEFDAVVIGPGRARVGAAAPSSSSSRMSVNFAKAGS